jgi:hypothetical protein
MLEKTLSNKIIKLLNRYPETLVRKRHAGAYLKGQPDLTGSTKGRRIEIEVKTPSNPLPTLSQLRWLEKWAKTGAITGIAISIKDAEKIIQNGLKNNIFPPAIYREMIDNGQYLKSNKRPNKKGKN